MPSPVLWGDEATVRDRFRSGIARLKLIAASVSLRLSVPAGCSGGILPRQLRPHVARFRIARFERAENSAQRTGALVFRTEHRPRQYHAGRREYLEVVATREGSAQNASGPKLIKKQEAQASRRAALLADRIEQGAAGLAAFAEGISEAEWHVPVSGTDHRSVGVIVHHVASMYPIEVDVARAVAGGNAITDVTWEVVAGINAKHAQDQASATKAAALELLRRNSQEAAAAVRALTDEQLDQAAPFSLSFGAPVTAQFVIEDHALRHSWHHLAKIRAALKR